MRRATHSAVLMRRSIALHRARCCALATVSTWLAASRDREPGAEVIVQLQAGRQIWLEGNHDLALLTRTHLAELHEGPSPARSLSPKRRAKSRPLPSLQCPCARRSVTRKCFAMDAQRIIMPAFGVHRRAEPAARCLNRFLPIRRVCVMTGPSALAVQRQTPPR